MKLVSLLVASTLILAGPAVADTPPGETTVEAEPKQPKKERPPWFDPQNTQRPTTPWFYAEPTFALGWWPGILAGFSPFQVRWALRRSDDIAFANTYAGVGGWAQVSPALVSVGGRFDLAPIDVFDLIVLLRYSHSFATSAGRLPQSDYSEKTFEQRGGREDAIESENLEVVIEPTLKVKVGPFIGLYRATLQIGRLFLKEETTAPYVFDAARDVFVPHPTFALIEQSGVVAFDLLEHRGAKTMLRLGAMVRHRRVLTPDGDRMLNVGFIGMFKPGPRPLAPTFIAQVLAYVVDTERVLAPPQIIIGAQWSISAVKSDDLLPRFHGRM